MNDFITSIYQIYIYKNIYSYSLLMIKIYLEKFPSFDLGDFFFGQPPPTIRTSLKNTINIDTNTLFFPNPILDLILVIGNMIDFGDIGFLGVCILDAETYGYL